MNASHVVSRPGLLSPGRKDYVNRQLQLELGNNDVDRARTVPLSDEIQESLVVLMADVILAVIAQRGDEDE